MCAALREGYNHLQKILSLRNNTRMDIAPSKTLINSTFNNLSSREVSHIAKLRELFQIKLYDYRFLTLKIFISILCTPALTFRERVKELYSFLRLDTHKTHWLNRTQETIDQNIISNSNPLLCFQINLESQWTLSKWYRKVFLCANLLQSINMNRMLFPGCTISSHTTLTW